MHSSVKLSDIKLSEAVRNCSGLLTTFGGSQELFAAGLAACGCQARSKQTRAAAGGSESDT